eukprot:PhF_6_TR29241/c0_g1_i2/m.42798
MESLQSLPEHIVPYFSALEGVSLYFIGEVQQLSSSGRAKTRILAMTPDSMYVCGTNGDIFRVIPYHAILEVSAANDGSIAFRVPEDRDLLLISERARDIVKALKVIAGPSGIRMIPQRADVNITAESHQLHLEDASVPREGSRGQFHQQQPNVILEVTTNKTKQATPPVVMTRSPSLAPIEHNTSSMRLGNDLPTSNPYMDNTVQMFCQHCGDPVVRPEAQFCVGCGLRLLPGKRVPPPAEFPQSVTHTPTPTVTLPDPECPKCSKLYVRAHELQANIVQMQQQLSLAHMQLLDLQTAQVHSTKALRKSMEEHMEYEESIKARDREILLLRNTLVQMQAAVQSVSTSRERSPGTTNNNVNSPPAMECHIPVGSVTWDDIAKVVKSLESSV